jgi:hypothetical protein
MGRNWLAGEGRGGEKLLILLMCSSICLLNLSFHTRKSNRIFYSLTCCSADLERHGDGVDR